jgi:hypothetical protein
MRRADIIRAGRGTAHAWRIERDDPMDPFRPQVTLYHYSTAMLRWNPSRPQDDHVILSLGWGSVSDQSGMNEAFHVLGLPYHYNRAGGADIVELVRDADGYLVQPDAVPVEA